MDKSLQKNSKNVSKSSARANYSPAAWSHINVFASHTDCKDVCGLGFCCQGGVVVLDSD